MLKIMRPGEVRDSRETTPYTEEIDRLVELSYALARTSKLADEAAGKLRQALEGTPAPLRSAPFPGPAGIDLAYPSAFSAP